MLDDRRKLADEVNGVKGAGGSRESVMGEEMNCWRKKSRGRTKLQSRCAMDVSAATSVAR